MKTDMDHAASGPGCERNEVEEHPLHNVDVNTKRFNRAGVYARKIMKSHRAQVHSLVVALAVAVSTATPSTLCVCVCVCVCVLGQGECVCVLYTSDDVIRLTENCGPTMSYFKRVLTLSFHQLLIREFRTCYLPSKFLL